MRFILPLLLLVATASPSLAEIRTLTVSLATECIVFGDPRVSGTVDVRFDDDHPTTLPGGITEFSAVGTGSVVMCYPGAVGVDECVVVLSDATGTVRFSANAASAEVSITLFGGRGTRIDANAIAASPALTPGIVPNSLTPAGWTLAISATDGPCAIATHGFCSAGQILRISEPATATGACCLGGSCISATEAACVEAGGTYGGDDQPCADAACDHCPIELTGDVPASIDVLDLLAFLDGWFVASQTGVCE